VNYRRRGASSATAIDAPEAMSAEQHKERVLGQRPEEISSQEASGDQNRSHPIYKE
jgi:hypothetical protein